MRTSHDTYVVRDGNVVADADFTSCIEDAAPIDVRVFAYAKQVRVNEITSFHNETAFPYLCPKRF